MNRNKNSTKTLDSPPEDLVDEVLKMDRLLYLRIIQERKSMTSLEMTSEILARKKNIRPEEVKEKEVVKKNPNINKRLKDLANLGMLDDRQGGYSLSPIGYLIINELTDLKSNIEILKKHKQFFNSHDYTVIPQRQFREIYKLKFATFCGSELEYMKEIGENTANVEYEIRIVTERLHSVPGWIMAELEQGHLNLRLVYQFRKPFELNFGDEEEKNLWKSLTQGAFPSVEVRHSRIENRNPTGIRIIDGKWAIFNLFEFATNKVDRPSSFYGLHEQFVGWVKDVFLSIWNESEPLSLSSR
ncbi:MAG: hypothetical protein HXS52_09360 [Theionarchaea archaeon]|nr:hypothetical protein [Theionarchaea archaeon]